MSQRWISLVVLIALVAAMVSGCAQPEPVAPAAEPGSAAPAGGQAAPETAPGQIVPGGVWTRAMLSDATILNPILSSETGSSAVEAMLFPGLIGQDPQSGAVVPDGSMSESWEVSDDGLVWTFHLRDGITWSDGDPIDGNDFKFTYDAVASDLVETPRKSMVDSIESIEVLDPLTVRVTFANVKCDGLSYDLILPWLPSHLYAEDFSDIMTTPLNEAPEVSGGPFVFQSWARDDNVILTRNESYWEGAPYVDGMIYKIIPDPGTQLAQLLNGEIEIMGIQPAAADQCRRKPQYRRL